MSGSEHSDEREQRIDEAIARYLESSEKDRVPSREEFLSESPDLAAELSAYLEDEDRLESVLARGCSAGSPTDSFSERPRPDLPPEGSVFGEYELLEEVGRGGMGAVYRARQRSLGRTVALKIVRGGAAASPEEILRFRLEANAIAELDHPNIVPLYEAGEHEGWSYFTTRFMEGGNLADHILWLVEDPRAAAELMRRIALAVHHAHTRGVLHRDLKPENIFLDHRGEPFVGDFGLAKRLHGDVHVTRTGALLGTPHYMAPEQARGRGELTTAADIYSLGEIFYDLLTGRERRPEESFFSALNRVIHEETVPPGRVRDGIPRDLETICMRCLEKEPGARYGSAAELAEDLRRWLADLPIQASRATVRERLRRWAKRHRVLAALLAASGIGLVVVFSRALHYTRRLQRGAQALERRERETRELLYANRVSLGLEALRKGLGRRADFLLSTLVPEDGRRDLRDFAWWGALDREIARRDAGGK